MSKRKLLLADDSVTIQKVVNLTFADEGIDVITVGDGDSAIEKISQISPDVVLADVHMPGLSGYQICEILRENPATRDLPVVLLVGSFEPFDEGEAARVGANAYMTKPFQSIRQLVSQVSELMEPRAREISEASADAASDGHQHDETVGFDAESGAPDESDMHSEPHVPDTSDIDSLINQSFSEPQAEYSETQSPHYVDAGMDDEMIDARHAEDLAPTEEVPDSDYPESEEFGEPPVSSEPDHTESSAPSPFDSIATSDESAAVTQARAATEAYFDQFSATEQIPITGQAPTTTEFALDELDLLELPPIDDGKTIEFTTNPNVAQGENKQVVSLSPELMEVIVQRVVEKLSQKD